MIVFVLCLAVALPVKAHLTGAFAEFLAVIYDEKTISNLKNQLDETEAEIDALTPKVEASEKAFSKEQADAITQLLSYQDHTLDAAGSLFMGQQSIVDLLGNQWIMKKAMTHYLTSVEELYTIYTDLKAQQNTLVEQRALLQEIEKSLARRKSYLAENEGLAIENIANYLDIDWTSEVEEPLLKQMNQLKTNMATKTLTYVEHEEGTYTISEGELNDQTTIHFYVRADHIYASFEVNKEHVLLIGQVLQTTENDAAAFVFEAGYYNGFYLPKEDLDEIPTIRIPYASLQKLANMKNPYVIQQNGFLEIKSK